MLHHFRSSIPRYFLRQIHPAIEVYMSFDTIIEWISKIGLFWKILFLKYILPNHHHLRKSNHYRLQLLTQMLVDAFDNICYCM